MKFALLLALVAATVFAQKTNWANVKGLQIGGEIRVSLEDGKSFRGQVQSVTDESLTVLAAGSQQALPRAQVAKVATKGEGHRARNAMIGLGIGAGTGLGVGAGIDHATCQNCILKNDNLGKIIFTPLGALAGLVVGLVWPTGLWRDIYRK